jgi:hypothetical protein
MPNESSTVETADLSPRYEPSNRDRAVAVANIMAEAGLDLNPATRPALGSGTTAAT